MKMMTMAQAMVAAINAVENNNGEVERVYPLEGSGSKENGYDYLLIGVETVYDLGELTQYMQYQVSVHCGEMTDGIRLEAEIIRSEDEIL